ncbi:MAG: glycine cleavage system aminomethyltransferase GcvT [Nitrospirae bacterium]|nr:glycine cleavage system aminomethyltransferase GcvT [Nitrospirota bacterium]
MKRTPLHNRHKALGTRFIEFAGWEMPLQYSGVIEEHHAVRKSAGLFDVSHLTRIEIKGKDTIPFINKLITTDLEKLKHGQSQYTFLCDKNGGIIDDLLVYKRPDGSIFLCANAINREKVIAWLEKYASNYNVDIKDITDTFSQIAIQGPEAQGILQKLTSTNLPGIKRFSFADINFDGINLLVSRTGYTGEDGFEIYPSASIAESVWDKLLATGAASGLKPAGLGARDTLRLEMGYLLYGNDIAQKTTPLEAGLERFVSFEKESFIGKATLIAQKQNGIKRRLLGFELIDKGIPRQGCRILAKGIEIGVVTSGNMSPTLKKGIGLGYVNIGYDKIGDEIEIEIRGKAVLARVVSLPFYQVRKR